MFQPKKYEHLFLQNYFTQSSNLYIDNTPLKDERIFHLYIYMRTPIIPYFSTWTRSPSKSSSSWTRSNERLQFFPNFLSFWTSSKERLQFSPDYWSTWPFVTILNSLFYNLVSLTFWTFKSCLCSCIIHRKKMLIKRDFFLLRVPGSTDCILKISWTFKYHLISEDSMNSNIVVLSEC